MHSHQHAPDDIWQKGVTLNFNTEPSEKMHGIIKEIYTDRTNFKQVESQVHMLYGLNY